MFNYASDACRISFSGAFYSLFNKFNTVAGDVSYQCQWTGNCEITETNRMRCSACRYQKCLALGMRKNTNVNRSQTQSRLINYVEFHQFVLDVNLAVNCLCQSRHQNGFIVSSLGTSRICICLICVCLVSSIGWAASYCAHYAVGPGFDSRGRQVDSAFHSFGVGEYEIWGAATQWALNVQ